MKLSNTTNRSIFFSMFFSLLTKFLVLLQSVVVTAFFGVQTQTDILFYVNSLILLVVTFVGAVNQSVFVPNIIRIREQESEKSASTFISFLFCVYAGFSAVVCVVFAIWPVPILNLLSGFAAQTLQDNLSIIYLLSPVLFFSVLNMLITDIFTAYKKFVFTMFVDMLKNLTVIAILVFPGADVGVERLALGMLVANIVQFLVLLVMMAKVIHIVPRIRYFKLDAKIRVNTGYVIVAQASTMVAGTLLYKITSGYSSGVYSAMDLAQKINTVFYTVVVVQFSLVVGVTLIEIYQRREYEQLNNYYQQYFLAGLMLITPISMFCSANANEIVSLLLQRGAFDAQAADITANFFRIFVLILPFRFLDAFSQRLIIVRQLQRLSLFYMVLNNLLILALTAALSPYLGYVGYPLGNFAALFLYSIILLLHLYKKHFPFIDRTSMLRNFVKVLLMNAFCAVVVYGVGRLFPSAEGFFAKLLSLAVLFLIYLAVYAAACLLFQDTRALLFTVLANAKRLLSKNSVQR